jgi:uncharacterized protein (TIGR02646 family)
MRYINKSNRCIVFDDFVAAYQSRLRNDWEKFKKIKGGSDVRLALHQHLWQEQKGLCAYCEQEIPRKNTTNEDIKSHLEHIRPKAHKAFKHLTFEFKNIIVSCEGFDLTTTPEKKREFCGHIKDQKVAGVHSYDDALFLNPTDISTIETFFRYDSEGHIEANPLKNADERKRADYMIEVLGLNHDILKGMRKTQYDLWLEKQFVWTKEELVHELDENQRLLPAFFSLLKQKIL